MFIAHDELIRDQVANLLGDLYTLYEYENYLIFGDPRDSFYELAGHIDARLGKQFLELAAFARVNDDSSGGLAHHATDIKPQGVGLLNEGGKKSTLTAREACNKIIHATGSRLSYIRTKQHPIHQHLLDGDRPKLKRNYIRPMLSLVGDRGEKKPWSATLDVIPWVHAVLHWSTTFVRRREVRDWRDIPLPEMREAVKRSKSPKAKA